jgi:hypothetical protein
MEELLQNVCRSRVCFYSRALLSEAQGMTTVESCHTATHLSPGFEGGSLPGKSAALRI